MNGTDPYKEIRCSVNVCVCVCVGVGERERECSPSPPVPVPMWADWSDGRVFGRQLVIAFSTRLTLKKTLVNYNIYLFVCVNPCAHVQRSEDNLWALTLSFYLWVLLSSSGVVAGTCTC